MADIPFDEAVILAQDLIAAGAVVFQKFTCENCDSRQTIDVPNTFYIRAQCEECNHVTDLKVNGCGHMVVIGGKI
jgi:hypothetical protein